MFSELYGDQVDITTQWPDFFDVNSVPEIPLAPLKEKPGLHKQHSISTYMNKFDIRSQLDRTMKQLRGQSGERFEGESVGSQSAMSMGAPSAAQYESDGQYLMDKQRIDLFDDSQSDMKSHRSYKSQGAPLSSIDVLSQSGIS